MGCYNPPKEYEASLQWASVETFMDCWALINLWRKEWSSSPRETKKESTTTSTVKVP